MLAIKFLMHIFQELAYSMAYFQNKYAIDFEETPIVSDEIEFSGWMVVTSAGVCTHKKAFSTQCQFTSTIIKAFMWAIPASSTSSSEQSVSWPSARGHLAGYKVAAKTRLNLK
jgi:hypothetical protein